MNFREWLLKEAAYTAVDMPDGVVVVRVLVAKRDPYFFFADADTLDETEEDPDSSWSMHAKPHGSIQVYNNDGVFRVAQVVATKGWGPLLHDLAMEYASSKGVGLGPDYRENSQESMNVWNYYFKNRPDVKKTKIDTAPDKYKNWEPAHYVYSKKGNEVTNDMLEAGLLVIRS